MKDITANWPKCVILLVLSTISSVCASEGDRLSEYSVCLQHCISKFQCSNTILAQRESFQRDEVASKGSEFVNTLDDFLDLYELSVVPRTIFSWDCSLNCKYKCVRYVTQNRVADGLQIVQFYGKWPFWRVWGITELFSTIFSIANFHSNYANISKIYNQYVKNKREGHHDAATGYHVMYLQYLILLIVSCVGWAWSTIFHIRDTAFTETMDYFGAIAIVMCNFNAIVVRYYGLYLPFNRSKLVGFQLVLFAAYLIHIAKLLRFWDYQYNVKFNLFFGVSSLTLWILHSKNVQALYLKNFHIYSNSIQLLPYETKILAKLDKLVIPLSKKPRLIPLLPIFLNGILLCGILLELIDFVPFYLLVDAHSLWHLITIFPTLIWFDWNIWDMELMRLSSGENKFN